MSEIPEVFAIFEQKLAHVLSFNLRQKGQKKAIEELLVYFSGIVERASKAEARIAKLEAENERLSQLLHECKALEAENAALKAKLKPIETVDEWGKPNWVGKEMRK